jgi:hypothetical protein
VGEGVFPSIRFFDFCAILGECPKRCVAAAPPIDIIELEQIHMIGRIAKAIPTDHDLL